MKNILLSRFFTHAEPVQRLNNVQKKALENFINKLNKNEYSFENVPCLCGNPEGELIGTHDRYGLVVHTHLCDRCGMMWTSPRMTDASLKRFYMEDYRAIYVGSSQPPEDFFYDQVERGRRIFNLIAPHFSKESVEPLKVFDVGCGAGGMLLPFKHHGWLTFGCDIGEEYLERGRDEGLVLEFGGSLSLSKYAPANLVILSHVLEHFQDPLKNVNEISRLLKDDGYLYIELPGIFNIHNTYGDFLLFLQNAHLYHFTLNTLSTLMASAGFDYIAGNENISALFQKTKKIKKRPGKNEAKKILQYLYLVEICRSLYLLRYVNTLKRVLSQFLRNHYKDRRRH